jgi:uncharacterized RDD family membrane protein YckC
VGESLFPLSSNKLVIGRSRSCDIRIKDDSVSRLHAALVWRGEELILEDMGSSNGTFANGERVLAPRTVAVGDVVRFGSLRGTIESTNGPAAPSPAAAEAGYVFDYTAGVLVGAPAGLGRRLKALLLDVVLFTAGSLIPFAPLLVTFAVERYLLAPEALPPSVETKALLAGGCGAMWVIFAWYYIVHGWARRGGTPGDRLCGLRVVDTQFRQPIGYQRALLRVAGCLATCLTLGLGLMLAAFRHDRRTLHDILAGTNLALGRTTGSA